MVLEEPGMAARVLAPIPCVESVVRRRASPCEVVFRLRLLPHDSTGVFIREGYPIEEVHVVISSNGIIRAVPKSGRQREWLHRNSMFGIGLDLCLWDPNDPTSLRWDWDDGLEEYVRIVSRHLIHEEYWRRHGEWPVEDSPHGSWPGGWPMRTTQMKQASRRWRRG